VNHTPGPWKTYGNDVHTVDEEMFVQMTVRADVIIARAQGETA